jgi:hypothetical protein
MDPERPLSSFLSWLIEEPARVEEFRTPAGFQRLMQEQGLPEELQTILRTNDLRRAVDVIRQETGSDDVYAIIISPIII